MPEQVVSVLVLMVAVFMASLNVTVMAVPVATPVDPPAGVVLTTVGITPSLVTKPVAVTKVEDREIPAALCAAVVMRILYVVGPPVRFANGVTVKTVFPPDATGAAVICTQVVKLSLDNWKVPEQTVFAVLVVIVVAFIAALNVTATVVARFTVVAPSAGLVVIEIMPLPPPPS